MKVTRRQLLKAATALGVASILPPPRRAHAVSDYFFNNSETSPLGLSMTSTYLWADIGSTTTRSSFISRNGGWSTRHRIIDPPTDQHGGKVIKWMYPDGVSFPGPPFPNATAWFSAWYYFDTTNGGWMDPGNWQHWANHMQWKGATRIQYQDGSPPVNSDSKINISMRYLDGTRRWVLSIDNPKYVASPQSTADTLYPTSQWPYQISGSQNHWANTTFVVPLNEWVFLETELKMTFENASLRMWSGTLSEGVLYLLHDMNHASFNCLKGWNQDPSQPNKWGTNLYLYFGIGNYQSTGHPSGTYDLYTDDCRISDGRIGPTLAEFSGGGGGGGGEPPPQAPRNLSVTRNSAQNRNVATARVSK